RQVRSSLQLRLVTQLEPTCPALAAASSVGIQPDTPSRSAHTYPSVWRHWASDEQPWTQAVVVRSSSRWAQGALAPNVFAGQPVCSQSSAEQYPPRSEEHTSELQSREKLVCRLLLDTKKD